MSLERSYKLQTEVENNPTLVGYQALVGEEMMYLKEKYDAIMRFRRQKEELEETKRKLLLEREKLTADRFFRELTLEEQEDYNEKWLALLKEYTKRKEILTYLASYSPADYKVADLVAVAHWLDTWSTFFTETERNLRELRQVEKSVSSATPVLSTQVLYDALDNVCRLQLQARSAIGRERYRRSALGDEAIEDFLDSQQQLMGWCRKQRETLEELSTLEDLAAFSDSFQKNIPVMDSNFTVLLDQGEPLADNERIQCALQELNEEWVQLCLMNYEKLQDAVREVHMNSPLEAGCAAWMSSVESKAKEFLTEAQTFLQASGKTSAKGGELAATCETLVNQQDAFSVIATHLS
ncbi:hypothetical protein AGDE_04942 [Angomonas deanei]|nr:hypothetical protein AGDE_04942 [Angomonas deanei]|eukprot:EPY38987.1 hypothetical protein AGDE_04942 [Angomonas deanei]